MERVVNPIHLEISTINAALCFPCTTLFVNIGKSYLRFTGFQVNALDISQIYALHFDTIK